MKHLHPVILLAPLLLGACGPMEVGTKFHSSHYSYYGGKQYEFRIEGSQMQKGPIWDPGMEPHPPLSASKALEKAHRFISALPVKDGTRWDFEGLTLVNFSGDHWAWKAEYHYRASIVSTGPPVSMQCWILMDGTVIHPKITKDKRWQ